MSGHNKWSQIKHKKAKEDSKRGAAFTKIVKEITVAAKEGGGDPATNARLRTLLEKAKEANMPQENISRAIKRGTGELPGISYEEYTYEGYGPQGIAIMVDTLSDNKNRTVAELRRLFTQRGGNLAENGAVGWMFDKMGVIRAASNGVNEETVLEALMNYNIHDIRLDNNQFTIICDPKSLDVVKKALDGLPITIESAELEWVPKNAVAVSEDHLSETLDFLSALQDHDDVQNVYANVA